MENMGYYVALLLAIIVAFYIIKKVASCLGRSIVMIVLLVILAICYFYLH